MDPHLKQPLCLCPAYALCQHAGSPAPACPGEQAPSAGVTSPGPRTVLGGAGDTVSAPARGPRAGAQPGEVWLRGAGCTVGWWRGVRLGSLVSSPTEAWAGVPPGRAGVATGDTKEMPRGLMRGKQGRPGCGVMLRPRAPRSPAARPWTRHQRSCLESVFQRGTEAVSLDVRENTKLKQSEEEKVSPWTRTSLYYKG